MNQQLRDLTQKAYIKQKMASEKSTKTQAVLDFNTQSQALAIESTPRKLEKEKLMGIQWKLQGKTTNSPWSNQPKESTK